MVSKINYVQGDVLKKRFSETTLICHICNDRGGFGSGYAGAVAKKWPHVRDAYKEWHLVTECQTIINCDENVLDTEQSPFALGEIQAVQVSRDLPVYSVQMIAQSTPGGTNFNIDGKNIYLRPIRLDCLRHCLYNVAALAKSINANVVGPAFGSGLAGGEWEKEIVPLIEECLCRFDIPVTIYLI